MPICLLHVYINALSLVSHTVTEMYILPYMGLALSADSHNYGEVHREVT